VGLPVSVKEARVMVIQMNLDDSALGRWPGQGDPSALRALHMPVPWPAEAAPAPLLNVLVDHPVPSPRELFERLHQRVDRAAQRLDGLDLQAMRTQLLSNGTLLLRFENGETLGLEAFVREASARDLLKPTATLRTRIGSPHDYQDPGDEKLIRYANGITQQYKIRIRFE
jgi:hypothetical protein